MSTTLPIAATMIHLSLSFSGEESTPLSVADRSARARGMYMVRSWVLVSVRGDRDAFNEKSNGQLESNTSVLICAV